MGTSRRMLIYHFGSREGLLAAVIDVMAGQQLEDVGTFLRTNEHADPREVAWATWTHLSDGVRRLAFFFERLGQSPERGHT